MSVPKEDIRRIDARYKRNEDKHSEEGDKRGLYIRIAESSIYEWKPSLKSLLKEIAYLRVQGESLSHRPYDDCRRTEKIKYDGWCWAGQEYLASRLGCSVRTIERNIRKLHADGVIQIRTWRSALGAKHNEYKVVEEMIEKFKREEDAPRPKCEWQVRKPNASWFSKDHQPKREATPTPDNIETTPRQPLEPTGPTRQMVRTLTDDSSVAHPPDGPLPTRQRVRDSTDHLAVEVGVGVGLFEGGVLSTSSENAPSSASRIGDEYHSLLSSPATQEKQPQEQKQNQLQPQHRGLTPSQPPAAHPAKSSASDLQEGLNYLNELVAKRNPELKVQPIRSAFATRLEYAKACLHYGCFPEDREPGLPVPVRFDYETRYEYDLACWNAGVAADNEDGTPDEMGSWLPPQPESYCEVCGLEKGGSGSNGCSRECPRRVKARAAKAAASSVASASSMAKARAEAEADGF